MKSLGVVLARGGSRRLERKNVRPLAGLPLVAWSCRAAIASKLDRAVLSTEDAEIAEIGRQQGIEVPFTRPAELAQDYAHDIDIVTHAIESCEDLYDERYDAVVLIQATTPFMRPEHLDACIDKLATDRLGCVFTVRPAAEHPRWMWKADERGRAKPFLDGYVSSDQQHAQNLEPVYYPNGAAWAIDIATMRKQEAIYCQPLGMIVVPPEYSVDIDDAQDLLVAEAMANRFGIEPVAREHTNDSGVAQ